MDREQLLQRKILLERKAELLRKKASLENTQSTTTTIPQENVSIENRPNPIDIATHAVFPGASIGVLKPILDTYEKLKEPIIESAVKYGPGLNLLSNLPEKTIQSPMAGIVPEPLKSTIFPKIPISGPRASKGIASGAIDVATFETPSAIGKIPYKNISLAERFKNLPLSKLLASSEGQQAKAYSNVEKLLPDSESLTEAIRQGKPTSNMVEQVAKQIQPESNYTDIADQLSFKKGFAPEERSSILSSTETTNERTHLDNLYKLIEEERKSPQFGSLSSKNKMRQYNDIYTSEVDALNQMDKETLKDPNFWEKRKEYYQKQANEAGAYGGDEKMSAKASAYRALAEGLQDKTYSLSKDILPLNLEYAGLNQGHNLAAELASIERGSIPPSIPKEIISSIAPTEKWSIAKLIRTVGLERILPNRAKTFSTKAYKAQNLANIIESLKATPKEQPLTYKPFANIQMPKPEEPNPFRGKVEVKQVDRSYTPKGGGKGISKENLKRLARRGIK